MKAVWDRGTKLPIHIGLPGPVPLTKLIRVSARIGVGDSLRFLRAHKGWLGRAFSGAFDPTPLVEGLDASLDDERPNLAGFHVFTFNDLEGTERWRQWHLEQLGAADQADSERASEAASSSVSSRPSA